MTERTILMLNENQQTVNWIQRNLHGEVTPVSLCSCGAVRKFVAAETSYQIGAIMHSTFLNQVKHLVL